MQQLIKLVIISTLYSLYLAFDGNLNQQILSQWQNISSKYISVSNRNITTIDSKTFNGLTQLEQLYVRNLNYFYDRSTKFYKVTELSQHKR